MELEASTIHSPGQVETVIAGCVPPLSPPRIAIGPRLLRLRSDEQLVALFRSGHDEAFRVIYDRYHKRLAGYARQMLPRGHDPEDVLQDVFVRAYRALRHDDRELAVRPWLFRVAHNCCIDELRRNVPAPTDELYALPSPADDLTARVDARETLRRLIDDIGRLPEQQRSALLLRELSGVSYADLAVVLETTVPAVKSLLVRARMGLIRAGAARDTACSEIREQLTLAHDQGVRATPTVRRHLQDCPGCRSYRGEMCAVKKRMAALLPAGPVAALARLVGLPGASGPGSAAPVAALGATGTVSGAALGANHVAALVAAAIATAGGAVGLEHVIATSGQAHRAAALHRSHHGGPAGASAGSSTALAGSYEPQTGVGTSSVSDQGPASGPAAANSGAGNASGPNGTGTAYGGSGSSGSPTPTAPPGWGSTGPTPTTPPSSGDTGPTPTSAGGDGSSGSPTPTTGGTGSPTSTGDSSGSSGSTSSGSTSSGSTSSGSTATPTGTTGTSTSGTGATTASAGDGSSATGQSTSGTTSSTGTGS